MISVAIVSEAEFLRGAIATLLGRQFDCDVVGEWSPVEDLRRYGEEHRPTVVIFDLDHCGAEGQERAYQFAQELPTARVLLLTSRKASAMLRRALAAGVWGLVCADATPAQLVRGVRRIAAGERVFDPDLSVAALRPATDMLTDRQRVVLSLAGQGLPAAEIAQRLFLSPGTVRNYLSSAQRKTRARNRLEAYRRAQEEGWL